MRNVVFLLVCLFITGCLDTKAKGRAESAVAEFHQRLDAGDFTGIYAAAHAELKAATTESDFVALLAAVHKKLGLVRGSSLAGWRVNTVSGHSFVQLSYKTTFAEGDGVESFNYRVDGGNPALLGYNINSNTLILK